MGQAITDPKEIPVISDEKEIVGMPIEVEGRRYEMTCVYGKSSCCCIC